MKLITYPCWDLKLIHVGKRAPWYSSVLLEAMRRASTTTWWRHQMKTFSALLALCEGNWPVTGEFPSHTRSFGVFFDMRLNKRLSKQSRRPWLRRHRAHYDVIVITVFASIRCVNAMRCKTHFVLYKQVLKEYYLYQRLLSNTWLYRRYVLMQVLSINKVLLKCALLMKTPHSL